MIQSFHDEADLLRSNGIEAAYLVEVLVKQPIALPDDFGLSTANRNFNQNSSNRSLAVPDGNGSNDRVVR